MILPQQGGQLAPQQAVNLAILMLSWLRVRRPRCAPPEMRLGKQLTAKQKLTASKIEVLFREASFDGNICPAEMGRTAAQIESLDTLLYTVLVRSGL